MNYIKQLNAAIRANENRLKKLEKEKKTMTPAEYKSHVFHLKLLIQHDKDTIKNLS